MNRVGAKLDSLGNLPPEVAGHLSSCTSCLADRRVAWLRTKETAVAVPPARRGRFFLWIAALVVTVAAALLVLSRSGFFQQQP